MNRVKKFLCISINERRLFFEALFWSFMAWFKSSFLPLKTYYSWLGERVEEGHDLAIILDAETIKQINSIKSAIRRSIKYSPWKSTCLIQAITTKKMLTKRKIKSYLYLSVKTKGNQLSAHAWVKVRKDIIFGAELENFPKEYFIYQ